MKRKSIYTMTVVFLMAIILVVVYFNYVKSTEEVYEGTLVWEGTCL